jgi:hypothetical protein
MKTASSKKRLPPENWTCPLCHRPFKHKNQAHSCVQIEAEAHLADKHPNVKKIYDKLLTEVRKFGAVKVSPTKSTIMFVSKSTFIAVKPKHDWIDIEFLLDEEVNEYPIHRTIRANKSRVAHFVRLQSPKDVSARLVRWLKASYTITSKA